jgi:hypothetical protein
VLVWPTGADTASGLPDAVIVADGQLQETVAWLTTYAPSLRPFSAHFRLIESGALALDLQRLRGSAPQGLHNAFAALVLAEALESSQVTSPGGQERLTVSACQSTLSWSLLRNLVLRTGGENEVAGGWQRARVLTRQKERRIAFPAIQSAVAVLASMAGGSAPQASTALDLELVEACDEIRHSGEIRRALRSFPSPLAPLLANIQGPRERRVQAVDDLLEAVMREGGPVQHFDSFLLAYAVSQVRPGSLTHASLLGPMVRTHPGLVIWLGLCAGLHPESTVAVESDGVGLRSVRDLFARENPLDRPRADIALPELEMFLAGETQEADFVTGLGSKLWVELVPGVATILNWNPRSRGDVPEDGPRATADRNPQDIWDELGRVLTRAKDLYWQATAHQDRDRQLDMFSRDARRNRKK